MASNYARRALHRSTASAARNFLSRSANVQSAPSVASPSSKLGGLPASSPTSAFRLSRRPNSLFNSRLPVQLSGAESLMPLHSATASALLKSMLSSKFGQWGCLSEGFATPL